MPAPNEPALIAGSAVFGSILLIFPETFDAPLYELVNFAYPGSWGALFAVLALARLSMLVSDQITGEPPKGRLFLSCATAVLMWLPFVASFWRFAFLKITGGDGEVLPGVILSVLALKMEIDCALVLKQRITQ